MLCAKAGADEGVLKKLKKSERPGERLQTESEEERQARLQQMNAN